MQSPLSFCLLLGAIALDLFPAWVAFHRKHPKRHLILFADILVGWTVIGWIVLLLWAFKSNQTQGAKNAI